MKREMLKELGLSEEHINQIMAEHGKAIAAEVSKTTAASTTITDLQAQITARDKDLEGLRSQSTTGNTELEAKIQELTAKYEADTEQLKTKLQEQKMDAALDAMILGAKGRNTKAIKALLDKSKIMLHDDGTLHGFDIEALKASDPYLFEVEKKKDSGDPPAGPSVPPGNVITQELFNSKLHDPDWINNNWDAITKGLADGTLKKGT